MFLAVQIAYEMPEEETQYGFRAPKQLAEKVETYRKSRGITKSDALRRLIERGLENETIKFG